MLHLDFEERVDAYEAALLAGKTSLRELDSFLPPASSEDYFEVLVEMLRITLEHQWQSAGHHSIESFRSLFPSLFEEPTWLRLLAFEEYRLRVSDGQAVDKSEYAKRYQIDVSSWVDLSPPSSTPSHIASWGADQDSWREFSQSHPQANQLLATRHQLPKVGEQFGPFELTALLGEGAFGRVFLAKQRGLADRLVAVKITPGRPTEAEKLAQLQHSNIVPVYSIHRRGKLSALCMPYLGGTTLADVLASLKRQSPSPRSAESLRSTLELRQAELSTLVAGDSSTPDVVSTEPSRPAPPTSEKQFFASSLEDFWLRMAIQLVAGLAQAHQRGIIHRDLKPANILIGDDGLPRLLDFNLATVASGHLAKLGGTLPYMAPEQLLQFRDQADKTVDARSDIYSLGVILFECLSGQHPFPIRRGPLDSMLEAMLADRQQAPANLPKLNPRVSPALAAITAKCLATSPADRYQSAADLLEDLQRQSQSLPLKHAPDRSISERLQKWSRRHPRISSISSVLSLALLVASAAGGIWYSREQAHARLSATSQLQTAQHDAIQARALLVIGAPGSSWESQGLASALEVLKSYELLSRQDWQNQPALTKLDAAQKEELASTLTEILLLLAQRADSSSAENLADLPDPAELHQLAEKTWQSLTGRPLPSKLLATSTGTSLLPEDLNSSENVIALTLAIAAMQPGDTLPHAEELLRELTRIRPQDPMAWLGLAKLLLDQNRLSESEAAATAAIALQSDLDLGWQFRGVVKIQQKDWSAATQDLQTALQLRSHNPASWFNLAIAQQAQEDHAAAVESFLTAESQHFPESRLYFSRARSYEALGKLDQAEADIARGLQTIPRDALSWVERALAQLPKHPQNAENDLNNAVVLAPHSRFTLMNLAHVQSEYLHHEPDAIQTLTKLLEVRASDSDALGSRAVLHARLGQRTQALADAGQLLQSDNRPPMSLYQAACVYALLGKEDPLARQQAFQLLITSFTVQPSLTSVARTDADLKSLHQDATWKQLLPELPVKLSPSNP